MPKSLIDPTDEIAAVRALLVAAHGPQLTFLERLDAVEVAIEVLLKIAEGRLR
jgi:hypothetical protein